MPELFFCTLITLAQAMNLQALCMTGPSINTPGMLTQCAAFDLDHDGDVDLRDVSKLMNGGIE